MPVPDYQSLMPPLLELAGDGAEHGYREAIDRMAERFHLSDSERRELLPSGTQPKHDNRVGWAITYLVKAGLLERPQRAKFIITDRGRQVLAATPEAVNTQFLRQYDEFRQFQTGSHEPTSTTVEQSDAVDAMTPEEALEDSYLKLRADLASKLLERTLQCSPAFFERLVVDLLVAMGYGGSRKDAGQAVGRSGDGGVDGIIKEDKLGLDAVYIQAKRWEGPVGRGPVQAFTGSLEGFRARKGVFITTSRFTDEAREFAGRIEKRIVLIDGEQLAQLMIDHSVGVTEAVAYSVKRVDSDYFEES